MSETHKVTRNILSYCLGGAYSVVCANAYVYDWESDVFAVTKKGYAVEFEVKISRADFKKDLEKPKHLYLSGKGTILTYRTCIGKDKNGYIYKDAGEKHMIPNSRMPTRFYYVCPPDLIHVEDLPKYAGLIYADTKYYGVDIIKHAPKIHTEKVEESIYKKLCTKMSWRLYKAQSELTF